MAYIIYSSLGDGMRGGPFPHKAGECCGNVLCRDVAVLGGDRAVIMNPAALLSLLLPFDDRDIKFRIGKPAEIDGRFPHGYAGVYLTEDYPLPEDAVEIDTDIFLEEVVSGERLPEKPIDLSRIRRKELYF